MGVAMNGAALGVTNDGVLHDSPAWTEPQPGQGAEGGARRSPDLTGTPVGGDGSAERAHAGVYSASTAQVLDQIQQSSEALLLRVQAAASCPSATQSLEQALTTQARRMLNDQLRLALAELDGEVACLRPDAPGALKLSAPPHTAVSSARDRLLETLCDLARRADVELARQQLAQEICLTANGLRQAVSQADPGDIQRFLMDLGGVAASSTLADTDAGVRFEGLVAEVRRDYGRSLANGRRLCPARDIEPDVHRIVECLQPGLMDALNRFKLPPQDHEQEGLRALRQAAVVLVDHELDTPEKVQEFLDHARRIDDWLAFATGLLGQVGYPVGMSAFLWGIGPQLAPVLLGAEGGFRGAAAFGAVAGAMIGYFDSVASAGASAVRSALSYAGSGGSTSPLASAMRVSEPRDIGMRLGISALATFTKNALLRAVLPSAVYAAAYPQGVSRDLRDHIDFAGDAGGGLFSGAAATLLTRRTLDCRSSQDFKLLTQDNLPEMIQRARAGTRWSWGAVRSLSAFGRGVGEGALAPSTLAVTGLVMTPLVALLMGINIGLVPGLALSDGREGGDRGSDSSAQDNILAAEHALKATVSSLLMAVLAGAATGVGQWVGRHADADCLSAVFGAVRGAAQRLRGGVVGPEVRAAVELTGVRRRGLAGGERGRPATRPEVNLAGHAATSTIASRF